MEETKLIPYGMTDFARIIREALMYNSDMVLPEYEMNKGYSDFYMQPNLVQLPDMPFSYVVEVKYCQRGSKEEVVDKLAEEASWQLHRYAQCSKVQSTLGDTTLIRLAVVFRGWELARFVEVTALG